MDTGPEVLTGSTRLKAGSATKAALNAVSTAAMVRAGKVFENLMVDLRQGSAKLRDRALRIVVTATGAEREDAEAALRAARGEVKVAIVALRLGLGTAQARRRLAAAGGFVRAALSS
jgi:N-acetylmuramic acid 6-phosphate etherase